MISVKFRLNFESPEIFNYEHNIIILILNLTKNIIITNSYDHPPLNSIIVEASGFSWIWILQNTWIYNNRNTWNHTQNKSKYYFEEDGSLKQLLQIPLLQYIPLFISWNSHSLIPRFSWKISRYYKILHQIKFDFEHIFAMSKLRFKFFIINYS